MGLQGLFGIGYGHTWSCGSLCNSVKCSGRYILVHVLEWDISLARMLLREGRVFGQGCEPQWAPECVRNGRPGGRKEITAPFS